MSDSSPPNPSPLDRLTLPVTPMIPDLVRKPYRRVDGAARVRANIERRRAKLR
jgi:hypothetical protein